MEFSKLFDGMSWFAEKVNEAIWGLLYNIASSFVTEAFGYVVKYIMIETDPNHFFEFSSYLSQMQAISLALLMFAIAWEGVKFQSGALGEEITLQSLVFKSALAAMGIFFLPYALTHFFIKISNLMVNMIVATGIKLKPGEIGPFASLIKPSELSQIIIIMFLILAIAFVVLAIVAGIRYVEIIILTLIAPLAAVSIVRDGDLLDVWVRETIAVVFTQPLQLLLLSILLNAIGKFGQGDVVELFIVSIAILVIMISGPQALRKFVHNTGVGSTGSKAVGNAGRMAVYKAIGKGAIK